MKKTITILTFAFACLLTSYAQPPAKISYQAVVRDTQNQLITNQAMGMQISILQGDEYGIPVYTEIQEATTNENGLLSVQIGTGISYDDFTAIDWSNGPYFLKTEIDPTQPGGMNYTLTSVTQLLSVPYAMHAHTAGHLTEDISYHQLIDTPNIADSIALHGFDGDYHSLENTPNIADSIATLGFGGNYHDLINTPNIVDSIALHGFDGDYYSLENKPNIADSIATLGFSGDYHDLINTPNIADSIATLGFGGDYHDLINTPDIADSIALHGFDGDYHSLENTPNIADSIATLGFSGDYHDLINTPDIVDSIALYGFDGDYHSLENTPNIADSIAVLGFNGDMNDQNIYNLANPTSDHHAATKAYVDSVFDLYAINHAVIDFIYTITPNFNNTTAHIHCADISTGVPADATISWEHNLSYAGSPGVFAAHSNGTYYIVLRYEFNGVIYTGSHLIEIDVLN